MLSVAALAALAAAPWWFGREAENAFRGALERAAAQGTFTITLTRYERGWTESSAETVLRHAWLPIEIPVQHRIHHGPLPLAALLGGELNQLPAQALIQSELRPPAFAGVSLPPLSAHTLVALDGETVIALAQPAFKNAALAWQGLSGEIRTDREWKRVRAEISAPGLALQPASGNTVTATGMRLQSDLTQGSGGQYLGEGTFAFDSIELGGAPLPARVKGLNISSRTQATGDTLTASLGYRFADASLGDRKLGPAELSLELRRLDAAALKRFEDELNAIYRRKLPPDQTSLMVLGKTLELAGTLARKSPEAEITRLSFKYGGEELRARAKFLLDGSRGDLTENPLLILTALRGEAEVSMPATVLKPLLAPLILADLRAYQERRVLSAQEAQRLTPEVLERVVEQALPLYLGRNDFTRLLKPDAGRYKLVAQLRQGQVLVNGEPWRGSLPMLTPLAIRE